MKRIIPEDIRSRTLRVHGIEIFPGIGTPFSQTSRFGAIFAAACEGLPWTRFFGWINYTPIFFRPGTVCSVIGGGWFLLRPGFPPLRGSFGKGTVSWNHNCSLALADIDLHLDSKPAGHIHAVLSHLPFPPSFPTIEGTLQFI